MTERTFVIDLTAMGHMSCVLLDGIDISDQLRGVRISAFVGEETVVELVPIKGARVSLIARLPEAHVVIAEEP